jgi:hypothetical protein
VTAQSKTRWTRVQGRSTKETYETSIGNKYIESMNVMSKHDAMNVMSKHDAMNVNEMQ